MTALAITSDGKCIIVAMADGNVRVLAAGTGQELRQFKGDAQAALAVALAPDDKVLATGGRDQAVHLWDMATGQELSVLNGHQGVVTSLAFVPEGQLLASGSLDRTIHLWDATTGRSCRKLVGHEGQVTGVAFAPDGKTLASGDLDFGVNEVEGRPYTIYWPHTVRLWDVATGRELRRLPSGGHLVAFSPDGKFLAGAGLETEMQTDQGRARRAKGGKWFTEKPDVQIKGSSTLLLWDTASGKGKLRLSGRGTALAFSPDGRLLATSRGTDLHHGGKLLQNASAVAGDGRLRLWEIATGQEILTFPEAVQPTVLAFAPDGRSLVAGMKDGSILLCDVAPGVSRKTRPTSAGQTAIVCGGLWQQRMQWRRTGKRGCSVPRATRQSSFSGSDCGPRRRTIRSCSA